MTETPLVGIDNFAFHRWFGEVSQWEQPQQERWSTFSTAWGGEIALEPALAASLSSPHRSQWFIEMAAMHPDFPDEDSAVAESVEFLRKNLSVAGISPPTP